MHLKSKKLSVDTENKIKNLLAEMTLEEKIGQLNQVSPSPVGAFEIPEEELEKMLESGRITKEEFEYSKQNDLFDRNEEDIRKGRIGSLLGVSEPKKINRLQRIAVEETRLHIPLLFGCDVIHGHSTVFPIPLAESCCFDDEMFKKTACVAAKEARANGINWTFAPMVDISRDARWGRIAESMGQDTFLAENYAKSKVEGLQGEDISDVNKIAACAKHYLAYGACESGRDYNSVDISMAKLYEVYLPPFKAAVKAGVASVMVSFNDINGVPMTANKLIIKGILRDELGFGGVLVSDATAIKELIAHGLSEDEKTASFHAFSAGVEIDMNSKCYISNLENLVHSGKINIKDIDKAVSDVLRLKFALGLFEKPYCDEDRIESVSCTDESLAIAKESALHSTVLLKNNGVLPIDKNKYKNISLIGGLSDNLKENYGCWSWYGKDEHTVTLKDALEKDGVNYHRCYTLNDEIDENEWAQATKNADLIIAVLGENANMSGEARSFADISLSKTQVEVVKRLKALDKPFVCVLYNGRPICIPEVKESADAIVEAWQLGTKMGEALADILFGRFNPCGKLTTDFPNKSGECPTYYNHLSTGRAPKFDGEPWTSKFEDTKITSLYSFGHGLSYTKFDYSDLKIEKTENCVNVSVTVANIGDFDGYEVAQLYIHDKFAEKVRPVKELKGYKKFYLKKGETKRIEFCLPYSKLGYYTEKLEYIVEKGDFEIFVGTSSKDNIKAEFTL